MALALVFVLALAGCSTLAELDKNDLGFVVCTDGGAPTNLPLVRAGGRAVIIGMNKDFQGQVEVDEKCNMRVDMYLPFRDLIRQFDEHLKQKYGERFKRSEL